MTLKLTLATVAERRKIEQCFHCNDMYTDGHWDIYKQLFLTEVIMLTDKQPPVATTKDLTISLHDLPRIRPQSGCTTQLTVDINGVCLTTRLDWESTHNFVDLEAIERVGIILLSQLGVSVVVANGERVPSPSCCRNMPMTIGSKLFHLDCFSLALGSYEMVLDVHWLESLGPILWDFCSRTISFVRDGHGVLWTVANSVAPIPAALVDLDDIIEDLLLHFSNFFTESTGLPPTTPRHHHIRLLPRTLPAAVHPYRYAHAPRGDQA
jgi:hypothetical protein